MILKTLGGDAFAMLKDESVITTNKTAEKIVISAAYDFESAVVVLLK
jgi:hypothetical protein